VYTGDDLLIKTARIDFDPWADQWYKGPCQKAKIVLKYPVIQNERKGVYLEGIRRQGILREKGSEFAII
jgi:hypothetical protein